MVIQSSFDIVRGMKTDIQKKEQLLLGQSRLAQMGEMLTIIAHQWRQPLSVIGMSAFSIQSKIDLEKFDFNNEESQKKFLQFLQNEMNDIHNYTQYLTGTIEVFTNFFKPNKQQEATTLDIPIEKALNILNTMIKKEDIKIPATTDEANGCARIVFDCSSMGFDILTIFLLHTLFTRNIKNRSDKIKRI